MEKTYQLIRKFTIAPVMAVIMLITLWFCKSVIFQNQYFLYSSIVFLVILPSMAYPLQKYIPGFRNCGREGQRNLAIIFAVAGYVLGCIVNLFFHSTIEMWFIYLEYLLSGLLIFLINKIIHVKASGHACGVLGPIVLLLNFGVYKAIIPGFVLIVGVFLSSLKLGRHTAGQLFGGSFIPIVVIVFLNIIF
ncbi:hypothetical protein [Konateibacter massiliensis]|uniref:hypothetical protein n=1 Tax=Konateibacter massiliensis TaxID=2002841 RepID=UPI000C14826E|nr:hypothetical protein [Konateibacter massiliensis]